MMKTDTLLNQFQANRTISLAIKWASLPCVPRKSTDRICKNQLKSIGSHITIGNKENGKI